MPDAYRARAGEARDVRSVYSHVKTSIYEAYVAAAAERGITKRSLMEHALMREINDPTLLAPVVNQQELPLHKTA